MSKKTGRPSNYRPEFPQMVYEYVKYCQDNDKLPLIKEFCYQSNINPDKIERYTKLNRSFRRSIEHLKHIAEYMLVNKGLTRKYDPAFAKFILAANYGYVETSKTINEGQTSQVVVIDSSKGYKPPHTTTGVAVPNTVNSPTEQEKPS
jgi:hypothetical protein